ncbi:MAG: aromatic ring-hydroxylating dioxygenase subunit alpha [Halioglobus sp.]|nr:aromatic ring-hydroxylating dioxygenase subunit alpha [Halioglobus sp.]
MPDPSNYFVCELGRESIIVLRNEQSQIRGHYNVCQHRGNRILSGDRGPVHQLACPHHGWRYGLDGRLTEIPDERRFDPPVNRAVRSPKSLQLEVWAGLIWLNMDTQAVNPAIAASQQDDRPEHERFSAADVVTGKHALSITLDQDIHYLVDMQAGMHSRGFDRAVLNKDEVRVHFHDWVQAYLSGDVD